MPICGWQQCSHEAASFERGGELSVADVLDAAEVVSWWCRNDPPVVGIPTPSGKMWPDFIYCAGRSDGSSMGFIEVKGEIFWDGQGSEARVKARGAYEWSVALASAGCSPRWEFCEILEQDALRVRTLEEIRSDAVVCDNWDRP